MSFQDEKQKKEEIQISIRLSSELLEEFDQFAQENKISRSRALDCLLKNKDNYKKISQKILPGLKQLHSSLKKNNEKIEEESIQWIINLAMEMGIFPVPDKKRDIIRCIQNSEGNETCFGSGNSSRCQQENCLWRKECIAEDQI